MDDYTVLKVIGEGSFGRALLVQQESSNQKYAMKEIRLPKSLSDVKNSRKEAILLAKMRHPNIVAFKESFEADGHLYIVMEYCDEGDLMQRIKNQKGKLFPEDMILHWFTQMCLGVNHIHKKRVLHRDIKSKNVFLTQNGNIKLGDFGSARLLSKPMAYACTYVGTPYYVPPEIWENMPYNNKSDIWSLGCILYELCTLKHPIVKEYGEQIIEETRKSKNATPGKMGPSRTNLISGNEAITMQEEKGKKYSHAHLENVNKNLAENALKRISNEEKEKKSVHLRKGNSPSPQRRQWEKNISSTAVNALENASILSSSLPSEDDRGGSVIKYSENNTRKQWLKESPETLLNILKNADLSLAFQTYTIYKSGSDNFLKGPLSDEAETSDCTDGDHDIILDPERLEPRLDEEDTDFEEEEDDPDWVSELKRRAELKCGAHE
ncbi:serine/threonine-protein kinase Nek3 isoform X3 [Monodelphis domestica]|uniref:serine/threonine-protein kinase Nek3 isoform X3 n=1 Tax=Monodelphis domestica TaxID=13616 RepID=UPI0024E24D6B|nr:serine/threonine-protein kinase Nek3 isoform X3 [Monodelphis domestica]